MSRGQALTIGALVLLGGCNQNQPASVVPARAITGPINFSPAPEQPPDIRVERDETKPDKPVITVSTEFTTVTSANLRGLRDYPHLTTLRLGYTVLKDRDSAWRFLTDTDLMELGELKELETLDLEGTEVGDAGLTEIKRFARLKTLAISPYIDPLHGTLMNPTGIRVTDKGLRELGELKQLTSLSLPIAHITDQGLRELTALKQLKTLRLDNTGITDAGMKEFKELPQLQSLSIRGTRVGDIGLKELKDMKQLRELYLEYHDITDVGMTELSSLKQLCTLDISSCNVTDEALKAIKELDQLQDLKLIWNKVTDRGLKQLKELKKLTRLNLKDNAITDAGLAELKQMKQLRYLNLISTKVTDAGVRELQAALPNCEIIR